MPRLVSEPPEVGPILRRYRVERGLTQEAVAAATGLDRTYIGMVERNERKPTVHAVTLILDALGVTWTRMGAALDEARPRDEIRSNERR
jgi:transcriptional regulator with XRE-family HTH domain